MELRRDRIPLTSLRLAVRLALPVLLSGGGLSGQVPVFIRLADGGPVQADRYGSGTRAVVLAHGGRFDRASWKDQAEALAAAGFHVLAIDFRAAVESRAGRETACLYDPPCLAADVLAAVRFLRQEGAETVALIGASLGGGAVAQASVDAAPGEIDRVVLLAAVPIATPERMQGRKLFITSRDDRGPGDVPRLPSIREQYRRAPGVKELLILEGTAHAQELFATPQGGRLMAEIIRFLSASAAPDPAFERVATVVAEKMREHPSRAGEARGFPSSRSTDHAGPFAA